jgi:hypothetical protein
LRPRCKRSVDYREAFKAPTDYVAQVSRANIAAFGNLADTGSQAGRRLKVVVPSAWRDLYARFRQPAFVFAQPFVARRTIEIKDIKRAVTTWDSPQRTWKLLLPLCDLLLISRCSPEPTGHKRGLVYSAAGKPW